MLKQCIFKNLKQNCAEAEDYKELLDFAQFWFSFFYFFFYIFILHVLNHIRNAN